MSVLLRPPLAAGAAGAAGVTGAGATAGAEAPAPAAPAASGGLSNTDINKGLGLK